MTVGKAIERKAQEARIDQVEEIQNDESKEKLAELEEFIRTYPEASAKKLAELDKVRIEERANLKHRIKLEFLKY